MFSREGRDALMMLRRIFQLRAKVSASILLISLCILGWPTHVAAVSQYCNSLITEEGFCVALLVPQSTVEKNSGVIYLRLTVPWKDKGWTAVGMGNHRMEGSLMFLLHKGENRSDVRLSIRLGT